MERNKTCYPADTCSRRQWILLFWMNQMFENVLTCLLLYSLKGLYKGTYTLPKQHKRRSGIRAAVVFLFLFGSWHVTLWLCRLHLWWHTSSPSPNMLVSVPLMTCPPSSVWAACHQENVCPDIDLCVCSFRMHFVSFAASQWGEFLYSGSICIFSWELNQECETSNSNWFAGRQLLYWTILGKRLLEWLQHIFVEISSIKTYLLLLLVFLFLI